MLHVAAARSQKKKKNASHLFPTERVNLVMLLVGMSLLPYDDGPVTTRALVELWISDFFTPLFSPCIFQASVDCLPFQIL